jgi:hypothetical protein
VWLKKSTADLLKAMQKDCRLSTMPTLRDAGVIP